MKASIWLIRITRCVIKGSTTQMPNVLLLTMDPSLFWLHNKSSFMSPLWKWNNSMEKSSGVSSTSLSPKSSVTPTVTNKKCQ